MNPNHSPWIIRQATFDDAPAIVQFLTLLFSEDLPTLYRKDTPPTLQEEISFLEKTYNRPNSAIFLAFERDAPSQQVLGLLDFHSHINPQLNHTGEFGLSIRSTHRNKGLGTELIEHLIRWVNIHPPLFRIELSVFSNNPNAIKLYEKMGFVQEGRKRNAVKIDNTYVDLIFMALLLNPHPQK